MTDTNTIARLTAELAEARVERDEWKSQADAVAGEAQKCFAAQNEIDEAWDAFGTRGNPKTLSLSEQVSSIQRELDEALARAEKAERERDAALAGAVEVRALEFSVDPRDGVLTSRETGQLFRVFPQADGTFFAPKLPNPGPYATAEEPIALLNEQHRTRTLAALHPSPDALQAVTANG